MNVFPIYRKSISGKNWYKIISDISFIEVQAIGNKYFQFEIEAKQYPEKLRIQDMIECNAFEECTEQEFNDALTLRQI